MEPPVRFAKTTDDVDIAFWSQGEGPAIVQLPTAPFSHVQAERQLPEYRRWYDYLSQSHTLIRYDNRGSGLSQRGLRDYSLDALVLDIEAVADRLRLQRLALFAAFTTAPVALAFAARHPDRVSHLILWCGWSSGMELRIGRVTALMGLLRFDWDMFAITTAHVLLGWDEGEPSRRFAEHIKECVTQPDARLIFEAFAHYHATPMLEDVRAPTLVMQRRAVPFPGVEQAQALATGIADARLLILEGTSGAYMIEDEVGREITAFLAREAGAAAPDGLSARELQVLRLIAVGRTNQEIANHLTISLNTVARHVSNIFTKTGAANRAEAASYAARHGLVPW